MNVGCYEKFEDEPELQQHLEQNMQQHLMVSVSTCVFTFAVTDLYVVSYYHKPTLKPP